MLVIVGVQPLHRARDSAGCATSRRRISERNRLDALQIIRIQQNLSTLAATLRDMLDRTEPYPMTAWANTFARLRGDLEQAFVRERELAPGGRPAAERVQPRGRQPPVLGHDGARVRARAGRRRAGRRGLIRGEATARHAELVSLVSQLFIRNTRVDEAAATRAREHLRSRRRARSTAGRGAGGRAGPRRPRAHSRHPAHLRRGAGALGRAAGAVLAGAAHAGGPADDHCPRAARRVRPDPHRARDHARADCE